MGLNVKVTTKKFSGENLGKHLYKVEVNKYCLNRAQTKEKPDKIIYIKIKGIFFFKTNH